MPRLSEPLLTRIAAGDRSAVAECLERYANLVWSIARRFTSSRSDAEDAVQEIFIELWSHAGRYDSSKANESTFVAMLARRRLIDRLRKSRREPGMEQLDAAAQLGQPDSSADLELKDDAARASRLIRTLKPEQQRVIHMSVFQGYSHQGIADELGMPLGTVKTLLRRGLLRVRDAMQSSAAPGGGAR